MAGAGGFAQQIVCNFVGELVEDDAGLLDHAGQLTGGQGHIHIGQAVVAQLRTVALELLGRAGHDGHAEDVLGVDARMLGIVALHQRAIHALRGLAGGQVGDELGIVVLAELDPAGAAGSDLGQGPTVLDALDELGAFLHDGHVGGVVHIEHLVEAQTAAGRDELAFHVGAHGDAEALTDLNTDGGCGGDDHVLGGIGEGLPDLVGVVPLGEGAGGAHLDALAAVHAAGVGERHLKGAGDVGLVATHAGADDVSVLDVLADGDAAAAQDALAVVADQVDGGLIEVGLHGLGGTELVGIGAVFLGQGLLLAVGGTDAAKAVHPVVGEHELQGHLAGSAQGGGVGLDLHPLGHLLEAGHGVGAGALHLDHAHTAGADGVNVLQVAEGGDMDASLLRRHQNSVIGRDLNFDPVDLDMNSIHGIPPYFLLMAPKRQVSIQVPHLMHLA